MHAVASIFPTTPRVTKRRAEIDTDLLKVEHCAPPPTRRAVPDGKYHQQFSIMRPGSCVRCESREMNAIAISLRKAIKEGRYPALKGCSVRSCAKCEDGAARVWALMI